MTVTLLFLAIAGALVIGGVLLHIWNIVRLLRTGRAMRYVVTLKSGVSRPYDYAEEVTRVAQPALYWSAVRKEVVGLVVFLLASALMLWRDEFKALLERLL